MSEDERKLSSLVKTAVSDALSISKLECPDCHASFTEPARYMDHRISEGFTKAVEDVKATDPEKTVLECKDGICKLIEEHVEEVYGLEKKVELTAEEKAKAEADAEKVKAEAEKAEGAQEEEAKGLWDDMEDEPEDDG